jgi:glycoprotein endo-alpha-1,2-mannosidase
MRRIVLLSLFLLALPASAVAHSSASPVRVTAFYYPWYGTSAQDGAYQHWSQDGHAPPNDIASSYYPARGLYSSSDRGVVEEQMREIRDAGIDEIAVSWWGRGSDEDARLALVLQYAKAAGIQVAIHLEPYTGRSVASIEVDVAYLKTLGISTFYIYRALDLPVSDWAAAQPTLHTGGGTFFAQTGMVGAAAAAGFDGIYTYDIVTFGGNTFARICGEAQKRNLLCAPSVGPGYDARRGDGDPRVKQRHRGRTYDAMWRAAIQSRADRVTITSFNEWHEGTQIEPAAAPSRRGSYRYLSYNGAWGQKGVQAEYAYLNRTLYWSNVLRNTVPSQLNTKASKSPSSATPRS